MSMLNLMTVGGIDLVFIIFVKLSCFMHTQSP